MMITTPTAKPPIRPDRFETIPTGTPKMQNTREAAGKARSL